MTLLTIKDVARRLQVSESTVKRLTAKGVIQCVRLGPRIARYAPDLIERIAQGKRA